MLARAVLQFGYGNFVWQGRRCYRWNARYRPRSRYRSSTTRGRGFVELAGGYQLLTRPEYHHWLTRLKRTGNELRLSPAMRETLAIIAYRQPIMRADIEKVRGVHWWIVGRTCRGHRKKAGTLRRSCKKNSIAPQR